MGFCGKTSIATPIRPPGRRGKARTFRLAMQGHHKILSNFDLRPKNNSMIGMPKFYWVLRQNFDRNSDFRRRDRPWQGTNPRVPNTGHKIQPNFEFWSWTLDSMMKNSWFDWILWRGLMDLSLEWLGTPMGVPRRCCKSPSRTCQSPSRASQGPPPIYVWFALFTFAASWSLFPCRHKSPF